MCNTTFLYFISYLLVMFECSFFFLHFLQISIFCPHHTTTTQCYTYYIRKQKNYYTFFLFFFILKFEIFFSSFFDDERRFCVCVFLEGRYILAGFFFVCLLTTTNCTKVSRNQIFCFQISRLDALPPKSGVRLFKI